MEDLGHALALPLLGLGEIRGELADLGRPLFDAVFQIGEDLFELGLRPLEGRDVVDHDADPDHVRAVEDRVELLEPIARVVGVARRRRMDLDAAYELARGQHVVDVRDLVVGVGREQVGRSVPDEV